MQADIVPSVGAADLDLRGGPTWKGLAIEDVATHFCEDPSAIAPGSGAWGIEDAGDIRVDYDNNHLVDYIVLWQGYLGRVHATSRTGGRFGDGHTYEVPILTQVLKDGLGFVMDWQAQRSPNDWRNELYDALAATFSSLPAEADCNLTKHCVQGSFGSVAYLYLPLLGHAFWVEDSSTPTTGSIPNRMDLYVARTFAFSQTPPLLSLDARGPTVAAGVLGARTSPCTIALGLGFADFESRCVAVTGDATRDANEHAKVLARREHDNERFDLDLTMFDAWFRSTSLSPAAVLADSSVPSANDTLAQLDFEYATSAFANDHTNNDPAQPLDYHGAGLVNLEYARLVQDALNALTGGARVLGDPACNAPALTNAQLHAAGCTGFEGMLTTAPPSLVADANMKKLALGASTRYGLGALRAGKQYATSATTRPATLPTTPSAQTRAMRLRHRSRA
jgi:hypothetical protein